VLGTYRGLIRSGKTPSWLQVVDGKWGLIEPRAQARPALVGDKYLTFVRRARELEEERAKVQDLVKATERAVAEASRADNLFYRLVAQVETMGGSIVDREWTLGGPQEVTLYEISPPDDELVAVAQSGVGLSLRGEPALVEALADRVALNRRA
jgi:hypothetical protein